VYYFETKSQHLPTKNYKNKIHSVQSYSILDGLLKQRKLLGNPVHKMVSFATLFELLN